MEKELTSLTIQLPVELKNAVEEEAKKLTVSVSALVRQRLSIFLHENSINIARRGKKKASN
jgi:predicted transcriptional regulator